jgi:membrane protein required for colicin V production
LSVDFLYLPHRLQGMNSIDIVLGLLLAFGVIQGFRKGFILELASLVGLILGVYGAIYFSHFAAGLLESITNWEAYTVELVAFIATFLVILIAIALIARLFTKIINWAALGILNRLLGAVFGLFKIALFLSIFLLFLNSFNREFSFLSDEKKENSLLYESVAGIAPMLLPKLFKTLQQYIEVEEEESYYFSNL